MAQKLYNFELRDCIFDGLYLKDKMSDVIFMVPMHKKDIVSTTDGEEEEKEVETIEIPAHKFILAAVSEPFHSMFYGGAKEEGYVKITDSYAGAFMEFLQLFYPNV